MPTHPPAKPTEDQLRHWITHSWTLLLAVDPSVVSEEMVSQFELLWGPCTQAVRHATAWASLSITDHAHESNVLARSALEHAVTAQWCYFTDDGLDRLRVKVQQEYHRYFTEMAGWQDLPDVKATLTRQIPSTTRSEDSLPNFTKKIVPILDADKFLAANYRALSRSVHVNDSTVLRFLTHDGDTISTTPAPAVTNQYLAAFVAATSAMLALALIADHFETDDMLEDLNRISNQLQLPMFLNEHRNRQMHDRYDN